MGVVSVFEPDFKPPAGAEINPYAINHPGILSWRNQKNGFMVATCHYTADPAKSGNEEWYKNATRDMRPDQAKREMEISFTSRSGQKAFGYLLEQPARWLIPDMDLHNIPKNYRIIASLDYGTLNPTAIYFYAIDNHRRFRTIFEFYKPSNVREIASVLKGTHVGPNMDSEKTDYRHPLWKRCEKVVVDGAIFNKNQEVDGGEGMRSVGDLLEEQGIYTMERATKDRVAGLERVHDMLNWKPENQDAEPYLMFCKRCKNAWREFTNLVYAELPPHLLLNKNMKEDIVAKDDHCFIAGTLISAPGGDVAIEKIKFGDLIYTRSGIRKVEDAGPTEIAQTYKLKFSNGSELICTANHPIWTENRGFTRADELRYSDTCLTNKSQKKQYSKVSFSGAIRSLIVATLGFILDHHQSAAGRNYFTEKFGFRITAQFLRGITFTIKTGILSIMRFPISNVCWQPITLASMEKTSLQKRAPHGQKTGFSQRSGIDLLLGERGTQHMQKKCGSVGSPLKKNALLVAQSLKPQNQTLIQQNSAQISAVPRIEELLDQIISSFPVRHAVKIIRKISTLRRKRVAVSVVRILERCPAEIAQVYNLRVEEEHEYFANTILVRNSYDSIRYSVMSIQSPSNEPPKPKPGDGTLGAVEKEMEMDDDDETDVDFF